MDKKPIYRLHKMLQIGSHHTNYCEDYHFSAEIGQCLTIAVMDGCTMGTDAYFAATLIGKLLRKICKELDFKAFIHKTHNDINVLLRLIMERLFTELKLTKNLLQLEREELLSTLLISVIDTESQTAVTLAIGDGLIICNGLLTEYEQNNRPDYLGYHLHKDFNQWYDQQTQRLTLSAVKDLSLSTDGIFTFAKYNNDDHPSISNDEIIQHLLTDPVPQNTQNWFRKKLYHLDEKYGLKPTDDFGAVRVLFDNK